MTEPSLRPSIVSKSLRAWAETWPWRWFASIEHLNGVLNMCTLRKMHGAVQRKESVHRPLDITSFVID